jgi:hypothetical protein
MIWVGMSGHRSLVDGYGLGMGTNSKENVGLWDSYASRDTFPTKLIMPFSEGALIVRVQN